jgi:hypothetical protein
VKFARLIAVLLGSGFALLVVAIFLSTLPASAAGRGDAPEQNDSPSAFGYTDHDSHVSAPRILDLYIDRDFDDRERARILFAVKQWNYALNGFVHFRTSLLPDTISSGMVQQIKRQGGWIVARTDSRNPIAQQGEGAHALAVTVGTRHTGYVYVISDRVGGRDLAGIVLHEFGHVLGAGHDSSGLMAPVYSASGGRCIDREAMAMVATVQHLPMAEVNWCAPPDGRDRERRPYATSQR